MNAAFDHARRIALLLLLLFLVACSGESPTAPDAEPFNGKWSGSLGAIPVRDEDWTRVTVTLQQSGTSITGELRERNGNVHVLTGTATGRQASITVSDLWKKNDAACDNVTLGARVETDLSGAVVGRCHGTLFEQFRLERD